MARTSSAQDFWAAFSRFFSPFHLYQFRNPLSSSLPGESVYARARTRWYFTRFSKIMQIFRNDVAQFRRWIAPLPRRARLSFSISAFSTRPSICPWRLARGVLVGSCCVDSSQAMQRKDARSLAVGLSYPLLKVGRHFHLTLLREEWVREKRSTVARLLFG